VKSQLLHVSTLAGKIFIKRIGIHQLSVLQSISSISSLIKTTIHYCKDGWETWHDFLNMLWATFMAALGWHRICIFLLLLVLLL